METTIQRAALADVDVVLGLLQAQFDDHAISWDEASLRSAVETMVSDIDKAVFLIARCAGLPVGLAAMPVCWTLEHGGKAIWLDELYVLPEYRNQGVGGKLMDAVEQTARELGCRAIDLEVEADHSRAENLYARHGFTRHNRTRWSRTLA